MEDAKAKIIRHLKSDSRDIMVYRRGSGLEEVH
jgi:hypothetical protein